MIGIFPKEFQSIERYLSYWTKTGGYVRTSGMGIRLLFNAALENGIAKEEIKRLIGLESFCIENPEMRFPVKIVKKLASIAFEACGNPALGLYLTKHYRKLPYKLLTHIVLNSATMLEAIQFWSRYVQLHSDSYQIDVREEKEMFVVRYQNLSHYQAIWLQEYYLSQILVNCHMYLDKNIKSVKVRFVLTPPAYMADYKKVFQAPVVTTANSCPIFFQDFADNFLP